MSRTLNSKRNIITGIILKLFSIAFPFFMRTVIIYFLGTEYLGVSTLFTSILSVLSLTELGFSSAIVYSMYKPISEKDDEKICILLNFYKKVYRIVGMLILFLGAILVPFLNLFIKGSYPSDINIYLVYLIYLLNTVISYFLFAYKTSIAVAFERSDLLNKTQIVQFLFLYGFQFISLILFRNFYAYIIFSPISTIIGNLINNYKINKYFPNIKAAGVLDKEDTKEIITKVKGLFINRIGDVSRSSFDNVVISTFFGLSTLAIFNNYYYVSSAIYGILLVLKQGVAASIGNSIASEGIEKNYADLRKFNFIFSWIVSFGFVCLLCLYQPFMELWGSGSKLKLSNTEMIFFCIFFYSISICIIPTIYISGKGLWWECRIPCIVEAVSNIILNIFLGKLLGIKGVLISTILTLFLCNFFWQTLILFKIYFLIRPLRFFLESLLYAIVTFLVSIIPYFLCNQSFANSFIIKLIICLIVPNLELLLLYFKNSYFKQTFIILKNIVCIGNR